MNASTSERPRLATLLPFPLRDKGGINTFVRNLSEALARDFEVNPVLIASEQFTARSGHPLAQLRVALRHVFALMCVKPDIVHTHEHPALLGAAIAYRALAMRRVRVVHTIHVHPARSRRLWKRLVLGWMLQRCTSVTAVSAATANRLDMIASPVPRYVRVVRGAASVHSRESDDASVVAFKRALRIGDGPTICQISPLNLPGKVAGVARLLDATALIRQRIPDVQLLLVGGGELRWQVERIAHQVGVENCTYFTDYLDDISVPLALADVYCQITDQDACPLSLLEAMCVGKAVVASRTGGIPELMTDGVDGVLVGDDPEQVAAAVLALLVDPERAHAFGACAAATVQACFNWERVAREFAGIFDVERRPGCARGVTTATPTLRGMS